MQKDRSTSHAGRITQAARFLYNTITFNSYAGYQEIPKHLPLLNLQEYAILKNTRSDLGIVQRDANFIRPELLGEGTNWQEEMFQKAFMQSYNLSSRQLL